MKLIIDITEHAYETYKEWSTSGVATVEQMVIARGTPLPKGHGRLIDADELMALAHEEGAYDYVSAKEIADTPTIIEADKGEEE